MSTDSQDYVLPHRPPSAIDLDGSRGDVIEFCRFLDHEGRTEPLVKTTPEGIVLRDLFVTDLGTPLRTIVRDRLGKRRYRATVCGAAGIVSLAAYGAFKAASR